MVEPQPDVPHAFMYVLSNLPPQRDVVDCELLDRRVLAEDGGHGMSALSQAEQALVLRVYIEQQSIVGLESFDGSRTERGKQEHGIGAVHVIVDQVCRGLN